MATALRPLTLGELLDRVFQLYRSHFILFVGISSLPNCVLLAFQLATLSAQDNPFTIEWLIVVVVALCLTFVGSAMAGAATVYSVSQLYLGKTVAISEAFAHVLKRGFRLLLVIIVVGFLILLGLLALLIPGIFLLLRWALIVPAAVIEGKGVGGAMGRSAELMRGQYGRVFLIYFLFFVLTTIFQSVFQIPAFIAILSAGGDRTAAPVWTQVVLQVGAFLSNSLIGPMVTIAASLVYYDGRVRREAFDIEHMVSQLEHAAPSPSAGL